MIQFLQQTGFNDQYHIVAEQTRAILSLQKYHNIQATQQHVFRLESYQIFSRNECLSTLTDMVAIKKLANETRWHILH